VQPGLTTHFEGTTFVPNDVLICQIRAVVEDRSGRPFADVLAEHHARQDNGCEDGSGSADLQGVGNMPHDQEGTCQPDCDFPPPDLSLGEEPSAIDDREFHQATEDRRIALRSLAMANALEGAVRRRRTLGSNQVVHAPAMRAADIEEGPLLHDYERVHAASVCLFRCSSPSPWYKNYLKHKT
jgi:hypothetical protein